MVVHPEAAAPAPPVDIDVQYKDEDKTVKRVRYSLRYPVIAYPDEAVKSAIAARVDAVMARARDCIGDTRDGSCDASCDVALATSKVASVHCQSMLAVLSIEDVDKAMGGAPGDSTYEAWTWAIEGHEARLLKVEDVFATNRLAALAEEVVRLENEAAANPEPRDPITKTPDFVHTFTVDREGVTFYPSGEEKLTYKTVRPTGTWTQVRRFLRPDAPRFAD